MLAILILAAGRGTRMKSSCLKVLHTVAGRRMVDIIIHETKKLSPVQQILVISPELKTIAFDDVVSVVQESPLGSGHAVLTALHAFHDSIQEVIICCGDTPLITEQTLRPLLETKSDVALMGMVLKDNIVDAPYGRLIIDHNNHVTRIVETKDATASERQINIANSGVYKIRIDVLKDLLPRLNNQNAAGEYYLTDLIALAHHTGLSTTYVLGDIEDFAGVNNRAELAAVTQVYQNRLRHNHMLNGVTFLDPNSVILQDDTQISPDVTIHPFTTFGANVVIESHATIFSHCHLEHCIIKSHATVGPFAHLRGHTILDQNVSIGNFVEVKGSHFKAGAKAKHLSYIGDAEIGEKVNIGAGVITCNYDGFKKSKTTIGSGAFIGANSSLVAPLSIGAGAIVGTGSTIVRNISENSLALARTPQIEKENGAITFREKHKKTNS